jgi:hypothetical protein
MATAIALIGVAIALAQLIVGLVALVHGRAAAGDGGDTADASSGELGAGRRAVDALFADRRALDALLIAAVCVLFSSVALLLVEQTIYAVKTPGDDVSPRLRRDAFDVAVLVGAALSLGGIVFARLAWSRWLHGAFQMLGVVLAMVLLVLSGVVGIALATVGTASARAVLGTKVRLEPSECR